MSVLEKITKLLEETSIDFIKSAHAPVHTSSEAAKVRGSDLSLGVKALVLYGDKRPLLIAIPGDTKLSFKKAKDSIGIKDLRMATAQEVTELTTLIIGSIPPLGNVLNLSTYFDVSIRNKDKIYFNAGSHSVSICMRASDLILLVKPNLGDYIQ